MTTDKQIQANRRNALKSTGPRTETGKASSSRNALRHGLTAEQTVLPHEDPRQFEEVRDGFIQAHDPRDAAELALVDELAHAYWRLLRLHRVETRYWEHLGGSYNRGDDGLAEALLQCPETQTRNFFRYYNHIERSYYRALAAVNQMRRNKGQAKPDSVENTAPSAPIGFVSPSDRVAAQSTERPASASPAPPPRSGTRSKIIDIGG